MRGWGVVWVAIVFVVIAMVARGALRHANDQREIDPQRDASSYSQWGLWLLLVAVGGFVLLWLLLRSGSSRPKTKTEAKAAPPAQRPPRERPERDGLVWRKLFYFGIGGAAGATLGWFLWIAVAVLVVKGQDVWLSAVVGGLVGVAFEGVRRYRKVSQGSERGSEVAGWVRGFLVPVAVAGGLFVGMAFENSLADVIKEVWRPFTISLVGFFVAGLVMLPLVWFAEGGGVFAWVAAISVGAFVAVPVDLVVGLSGDRPEGSAVWWSLAVVVVLVMAAVNRRWAKQGAGRSVTPVAVLMAVAAGLCVAGVTVLLVLVAGFRPVEVWASNSLSNTLRGLLQTSAGLTEGLFAAPDVPASAWKMAESQVGSDPIRPSIPAGVSRWIADLGGCDSIPDESSTRQPERFLERKREMCRQIDQGVFSTWLRSCIVLGMFCLGLIAASAVESERPLDYARHPVKRYDRIGLALCCGVAVVFVLLW